jgi:hypothetical protein
MRRNIRAISVASFKASLTKLRNRTALEHASRLRAYVDSQGQPAARTWPDAPLKDLPFYSHVYAYLSHESFARFKQIQAQPFTPTDARYLRDASHIPGIFGLKGSSRLEWRLGTGLSGEINGLPSMRGKLVATNGVLCALEREDGALMLGHLQHFIPDVDNEVNELIGKNKPRKSRLEKTLADYA